MQTLAIIVPKKPSSFRARILKDLRASRCSDFWIMDEKRWGRQRGWARIESDSRFGNVQLLWEPTAKLLLVRSTSRVDPSPIHKAFLSYLRKSHSRHIDRIKLVA